MEQSLISVVMPTYNCNRYVEKAIKSILNQTYQTLELIIVDGHSNDGTEEILNKYANIDDRVQIVYDEGKGIGAALKLGCELAKGEYIARMDSDDISLPQRLEMEMKTMKSDNKIVLVSCSAIYIDENDAFMGFSFPYTLQCLLKKNPSSILHPGVLMRKDAYSQAGGYPAIMRVEDYFLWSRLINQGVFKIIKYPLMKYRITTDALSNSMSEYFAVNFPLFFRQYIEKEIVTVEDEEIINNYIKGEIKHSVVSRKNPVREVENRLFHLFSVIFSDNFSFKLVFCLKNVYGILLVRK